MIRQIPQVSVCIPTYNRAGMLKESIESVLAQTFQDFELIVSDNASTDDTEQMVRSFHDRRIVYSRNAENFGWQWNMGQVLSLAKGELLGVLPDDDIMLPDNLARKVEVLRRYPHAGLVHSKYHLIDAEGRVIRPNTNWGHGPDRVSDAIESGQEVLRSLLLGYNTINLPTVLYRRECYDRLGGFTKALSHADDYEYWMKIAAHYDVAFVAEPLVKWRIHSGTLTNQFCSGLRTGVSNEGLREHLLAKWMILATYRSRIQNYTVLKEAVRQVIIERVVFQADMALDVEGQRREVRAFLFRMCREIPVLYRSVELWRTVVKTFFTRRGVLLMKRLCSPMSRWKSRQPV